MRRDKQKRLDILFRIDQIVDNHCKNCEQGNGSLGGSNRYCLDQCEHGKKLQEYGNMLIGDKKEAVKVEEVIRSVVKPSKEAYVDLKAKGLNDRKIAKHFGIGYSTLSYKKKNWNVTKQVNPSNDQQLQEQMKKLNKELEEERIQTEALQKELNQLRNDYEALENEKENNQVVTSSESYDQMEKMFLGTKKQLELEQKRYLELVKSWEQLKNQYEAVKDALKVML